MEHVTKEFCALQHKTTNEKLDTIIRDLRGNGKEGLVDKVGRHESILKAGVWVVACLVAAITGVIIERLMK